jgi:hypothetical protein
MKSAQAAGQMSGYRALRGLLKVIKRGGRMCFIVGVALGVFEELDLWSRAIENSRTPDAQFREDVGTRDPFLWSPFGFIRNPYYDPRSGI